MKISVVTVCYNAAATIAETLESVAGQAHADVEHIVVDGQSIDGTQDIVARHSHRVARFVSEPDLGLYDAMNKGLALATGEIVAFLNADDLYVGPHVLERVDEIMNDPSIGATYADLFYVDPHDTQRVVRVWKSRDFVPGMFARGWMPAHPTLFVRREILAKSGGFDLQFRLQADFDLVLRLFEIHKLRSRYVPEYWVQMRAGGISNKGWRSTLRGNVEAWQSCRKNGLRVAPWFILVKMGSRLNQFWHPREILPLQPPLR